ncbi:signal peptidase I [Slackia exigua]|uniref:signal peptidase I n=1 Tax=Slackia exigua TaxID=84109 RepID=UPI0028EB2B03|nr:signal peptidase I [Slackia exigua]
MPGSNGSSLGVSAGSLDPVLRKRIGKAARRRAARRFLVALGATALATYLLFGVLFGAALVEGSSMEPAYQDGDLVLFSRMDRTYAAGDVVLVGNGFRTDLIKRVIATPGQDVDLKGGSVLVDGMPLVEPYAVGATEAKQAVSLPLSLAEDEYFVLGDSRDRSRDSRSFGPVERSRIDGRVIAVLRLGG